MFCLHVYKVFLGVKIAFSVLTVDSDYCSTRTCRSFHFVAIHYVRATSAFRFASAYAKSENCLFSIHAGLNYSESYRFKGALGKFSRSRIKCGMTYRFIFCSAEWNDIWSLRIQKKAQPERLRLFVNLNFLSYNF